MTRRSLCDTSITDSISGCTVHPIQIKPSRPGGGHGKPLNFHKSSGRPGDSQRTNLKSEVSVCLRRLGVPPRPPKRVSSWRAFCGRITVILGRPWCQGTALVPGKPALVPAGPARNTRESVVGHFCGKDRIVKYCVVVLNYLFGVSKNSQLPFLASFLV